MHSEHMYKNYFMENYHNITNTITSTIMWSCQSYKSYFSRSKEINLSETLKDNNFTFYGLLHLHNWLSTFWLWHLSYSISLLKFYSSTGVDVLFFPHNIVNPEVRDCVILSVIIINKTQCFEHCKVAFNMWDENMV